MATPPDRHTLTAEEYLAIERRSEGRHEFYRGEMFAMAGGSRQHARILSNLVRLIGNHLVGGPCEVFASDMRVLVKANGLSTYPDLSVVCGEARFQDSHVDTLLNPVLIVEILSPSTEVYDRTQKFAHYREMASLREYILVSQERMAVESYRRTDDGWLWVGVEGPEAQVVFETIGCAIPLTDIYARVEFPEELPQGEAHPGPPPV